MGEVLLFTLSFALGIYVPWAVVRRDLSRLTGQALARSWPDSSLLAAVVAFGPLCVPVHFIRTRRTWLGVLLGLGWLIFTLLLVGLPVELLARIFGVGG